jgi:hypothetical protein
MHFSVMGFPKGWLMNIQIFCNISSIRNSRKFMHLLFTLHDTHFRFVQQQFNSGERWGWSLIRNLPLSYADFAYVTVCLYTYACRMMQGRIYALILGNSKNHVASLNETLV